MRFIPTLIICKEDLHKNEKKITELHEEASKKNKKGTGKWYKRAQALNELQSFLKNKGFIWRKEWLVMEQPDLTWLNQAVRDMMDEIGIYFSTYN